MVRGGAVADRRTEYRIPEKVPEPTKRLKRRRRRRGHEENGDEDEVNQVTKVLEAIRNFAISICSKRMVLEAIRKAEPLDEANEESVKKEVSQITQNTKREKQIFVRTTSGKTLMVRGSQTNTAESVKNALEEWTSTPATHQRLTYQGKELVGDRTLEVPDGAQVHQSIKLRGGMPTQGYGVPPWEKRRRVLKNGRWEDARCQRLNQVWRTEDGSALYQIPQSQVRTGANGVCLVPYDSIGDYVDIYSASALALVFPGWRECGLRSTAGRWTVISLEDAENGWIHEKRVTVLNFGMIPIHVI